MLKIVVTITDWGAVSNVGRGVDNFSEIIEIPTENIPPGLKLYLDNEDIREYQTISCSILREEKYDIGPGSNGFKPQGIVRNFSIVKNKI